MIGIYAHADMDVRVRKRASTRNDHLPLDGIGRGAEFCLVYQSVDIWHSNRRKHACNYYHHHQLN
jgi:hypothetical protein